MYATVPLETSILGKNLGHQQFKVKVKIFTLQVCKENKHVCFLTLTVSMNLLNYVIVQVQLV